MSTQKGSTRPTDKRVSFQEVESEINERSNSFAMATLAGLGWFAFVFLVSLALFKWFEGVNYQNYVSSLKDNQGFLGRIFNPVQPMSFGGYIFSEHPIVCALLFIVTFTGTIHFFISLLPGPKSEKLLAYEEKKSRIIEKMEQRSERYVPESTWLVEIRFYLKSLSEESEQDDDELRHGARLEIARYFKTKGISLTRDPFVYYPHSNNKDEASLRIRNHNRHGDLHYYALLIFSTKATDYGKALLNAEKIAQEFRDQLSRLEVRDIEIFQFAESHEPSVLDTFGEVVNDVANLMFGAAIFTGATFVTYQVGKAGVKAAGNVSDATLGRAGRLIDATTKRIEPH